MLRSAVNLLGGYPYLDRMFPMVVKERDGSIGLFNAIDSHICRAAVVCLEHGDMVDGFPVAVMHLEALPMRGQARRETQFVCFKPQPEKRFKDKPVHPAGRSRVPRP